MNYDAFISFNVDLIVENGDVGKINDLFVDFLNDLDGVKSYSLTIKRCLSLHSNFNKDRFYRKKGGSDDGESKKDAS